MTDIKDPWSAQRGRYSSGRVATDPITGRAKRDDGEESIDDFARRHDWEVRRMPDESLGYYKAFRFAKGLKTIDVTLYNDTTGRIAMCRAGRIDIPRMSHAYMRTRLERAIVGMDCSCEFRDWPDDHVIDVKCLVHGWQESEDVAAVRGIDVEQATQEALGI